MNYFGTFNQQEEKGSGQKLIENSLVEGVY